MELQTTKYIDYNIFSDKLENLPIAPQLIINTINQYSFCIAEEDHAFKTALQQSDILLPDGIGIVVAVKMVTHKIIEKITGADIHDHLLKMLNRTHGKCFYLGSSENTLKSIKKRLFLDFPNIQCDYFSPPFNAAFSDNETQEMIQKVNTYQPDVLFVGMTAPKQEKWVNENKHNIKANYITSIGAVFDFYAGTVKRPDKIWIDLKLEWFVRLVKEPKRMWKRYLYYGPVFLYKLLKERSRVESEELLT